MKIRFIKRQDIVNLFLDRINEGYELTQEEKEFLIDLTK